jgi:hypothetical protein
MRGNGVAVEARKELLLIFYSGFVRRADDDDLSSLVCL